VIPDVPETIIDTVNAVRPQFDYVFTTGGIGPTHDDITAECIARAFGVQLVLDAEARRRLEVHYPAGGLNEARLRMAHVPEGATLIDNPVSQAPGFQIGNVLVMAGVPRIMQAMFDGVRHRLAGGVVMVSLTVSCNLPEGTLAAGLTAIQNAFPDLELGSYPFFQQGKFGTSLVLRGPDLDRLRAARAQLHTLIRSHGGEPQDKNPD